MTLFVTPGPGTNHELVARAYLAFHSQTDPAALGFVASAEQGARRVLAGEADYLILCSVHPEAPGVTGRHYRALFAVDAFISPSKPLAIVTRRDAPRRGRLGLLQPTRDYADVTGWSEVVEETQGSIVDVWGKLLAGAYDSALVYLEYAAQRPDLVWVEQELGSPDDTWIVFGRERASGGGVLASADSVIGRRLAGEP
jgi:hypothetical protein